MNGTEDILLRKVRDWIRYADEDLRLARHGLTLTSGCPYRLIAYHAQQCAEKYLKGFLVLRGVDFPYTHSISRLLELCAKHAGWAATLDDAEELTPFAITARYPGRISEVTREEALRAIEIASMVRETVGKALREHGMSPEGPDAGPEGN